MRGQQQRGFTLVEMILVVAIIIAATSLAIQNISAQKQRIGIEDVLRRLRGNIERARAISMEAASFVGVPGAVVGGCPAPGGPVPPSQLWLRFDPVAMTLDYPSSITPVGPGNGRIQVACQTLSLLPLLPQDTEISFTAPLFQTWFAFAPNGRVIEPGGPAPLLFSASNSLLPNGRDIYAFRLLTSGITCNATRIGGAALCDANQND
jgi:prepilin-type N-terminal cleavage/methylation domain-containing protein